MCDCLEMSFFQSLINECSNVNTFIMAKKLLYIKLISTDSKKNFG